MNCQCNGMLGLWEYVRGLVTPQVPSTEVQSCGKSQGAIVGREGGGEESGLLINILFIPEL